MIKIIYLMRNIAEYREKQKNGQPQQIHVSVTGKEQLCTMKTFQKSNGYLQ